MNEKIVGQGVLRMVCTLVLMMSEISLAAEKPVEGTKSNVLLIAVDDLRPQMGCYGDEDAVTPHMDRLAQRGMVFRRAYRQQAVCNPSRASLMTGGHPDTIRVWDLGTHFRRNMPNVVTLPQHFKNHGYHAECIGKIYHDGRSFRDAPSWSVPEQLAFTGEVREAALSQFPHPAFGRRTHMGYSIRTDRYRYTEWRPLKTGDIAARELYDHGNDPNETVNLAEQTAHAETVERLQGKLRELTRR